MNSKNNNEVTNFMYYMYNTWSESESINVFGNDLGLHIFQKWLQYERDSLRWYAELDGKCRKKLVDRANALYG